MTEQEMQKLLEFTDSMDNNTAVLVKRMCQSYAMAVAERDTVTKRMVRLEWQVSALIRALSTCDQYCEHCLYAPDITECAPAEWDCKKCEKSCRCKMCADGSNWSWKGVEYDKAD